MMEVVRVAVRWEVGKVRWADFAERFGFRPGPGANDWPAIAGRVASVITRPVAWDVSPVFGDDNFAAFAANGRAGCRPDPRPTAAGGPHPFAHRGRARRSAWQAARWPLPPRRLHHLRRT